MSHNNADIDHLLKFATGEFSVTGTLKIQANTPPELITRDSLIAYMRGRDIQPSCVCQNGLDQLIAEVAEDTDAPHERVVAKGRMPEHGRNATIELRSEIGEKFRRIQNRKEAFLIAQRANSFESDEGSAINFYNESSFVSAREGEHLANFIEHTDGADGIDIHGKSIAAKPGKPIANPIDDSCRMERDGRIIAMQDGLVQFSSERISINPTLNIPGFVDFSTGHIIFPGNIVIEKGVRDRFRVQSDLDIEIHKLVEAAHLHADNNIRLLQGMAGRESGTVYAKGDLQSGYLDAVDATIMGNCVIEKEVTNCTIRISGRIEAKSATIRGGLIEVAHGGIIGSLGSSSGVHTELALASHPVLQQKIGMIEQLQPKLIAEIERAQREINGLKAVLGRSNPELETEIWYLESNIQSLKGKQNDLDNAMQRLLLLLEKHTHCNLTIVGQLFAKTILWVPGKRATFERDIKGEFTIRLDQGNEPVVDWGNRVDPLKEYAKVHSDERIPSRRANVASKAA